MKMPTKIVSTVMMAGAVAGAPGAAEAADKPVKTASLSSVNGKVLIHGGRNYALAEPGSVLAVGDRIVTLRDGRADVAFANDCVVRLHENSVLAIDKADMCADIEPVQYAEAIGTTTTDVAQLGGVSAALGGGAAAASAGAGAGAGGLTGLSSAASAAIGFGSVATAGAVDMAVHRDSDRPISGQ